MMKCFFIEENYSFDCRDFDVILEKVAFFKKENAKKYLYEHLKKEGYPEGVWEYNEYSEEEYYHIDCSGEGMDKFKEMYEDYYEVDFYIRELKLYDKN